MARINSIVRRDKATGAIIDRVEAPHHGAHAASPVAPSKGRFTGLGDLTATFAQPVAALIDTITERMLSAEHKTALGKCPACARRHNKLNLLCPDVLTCPFLGKLLELLPEFARKALLEAAAKRAGKR